jgi:acetyl esterase
MTPLSPEAQAFLAAGGPARPWPSLTPTEARAQALAARRPDTGAPTVDTLDTTIPRGDGSSLAVRVYRASDEDPVLVFFHGGGWVYGDLDMADGFCRRLSVRARVTICSVDYRLAPEHPFPAPLDDAVRGTTWASENLAAGGPVGVIGSSAGGNLAAATCLVARDRHGPPIGLQVLLCPVTDCGFDTPSYAENAGGKFLEADDMRWYWAQYLAGGGRADDPYVSVLRADLHGLAPALVITAQHDVLRDEGEAYAEGLAHAGVDVALRRFDGLIHAFAVMSAFPLAQAEAIEEIATAIDRWLRPTT